MCAQYVNRTYCAHSPETTPCTVAWLSGISGWLPSSLACGMRASEVNCWMNALSCACRRALLCLHGRLLAASPPSGASWTCWVKRPDLRRGLAAASPLLWCSAVLLSLSPLLDLRRPCLLFTIALAVHLYATNQSRLSENSPLMRLWALSPAPLTCLAGS